MGCFLYALGLFLLGVIGLIVSAYGGGGAITPELWPYYLGFTIVGATSMLVLIIRERKRDD